MQPYSRLHTSSIRSSVIGSESHRPQPSCTLASCTHCWSKPRLPHCALATLTAPAANQPVAGGHIPGVWHAQVASRERTWHRPKQPPRTHVSAPLAHLVLPVTCPCPDAMSEGRGAPMHPPSAAPLGRQDHQALGVCAARPVKPRLRRVAHAYPIVGISHDVAPVALLT